jgi:glutathione S-transferase
MKATLYQFITSPFCAKVRKILDFKGIDYEIVEVDYVERKELLAASGQVMVPALRLEHARNGGDAEVVVDSNRIAARLEELCPEPTILPPQWRGLHMALTNYIEGEVEEALFRVGVLDELAHFARQGPDRLALFRFIRDRKYGADFCERMERERESNLRRMCEVLHPFERALENAAFLMGRIGLADFALYGQLHFLALTEELKIPADLVRLRDYYLRIDRISSRLEDSMA